MKLELICSGLTELLVDNNYKTFIKENGKN